MFCLTTHSTFYRHMVKDHSDSERENPLQPHGLDMVKDHSDRERERKPTAATLATISD